MMNDPRNAVFALLLADIRDAFAKQGGVKILSASLVKVLVVIEGRPWASMERDQNRLARILKPLGIAPDRIDTKTRARGYRLWQFEEAFLRYLPPEGLSAAQGAANTGNGSGLSNRRIQELAEWRSQRAYWHYSPNALAAGELDAELRAILRREVPEQCVEIEFERVLKSSR
jgi:uncharacterized protein DUF3631